MGLSGLVALVAIAVCLTASAERRLFIRDLPDKGPKCRNTIQGLNTIADDRGFVCKRSELNYGTGCCEGGAANDCSMCDMRDQCCTEYEACVSCCLAPQHEAAKLAKEVLRSPRHKESGVWGDAFSYCMGVCRTHSRSTAHENSYISPRHHCFSKLGRPMLSDPLPPGALADVEVVTSERNGTCDEACTKLQGKPKKCSIVHLNVLNSCDRLREHHGCEAGCEEASGLGPSYVDPEAPKPARPAMCFVQPQGDPLVQCGSRTPHHMMLCACSAQ